MRGEAAWRCWGRGKQSLQLDLKTAGDLAVARGPANDADVLIETFRPGVADRLRVNSLIFRLATLKATYKKP